MNGDGEHSRPAQQPGHSIRHLPGEDASSKEKKKVRNSLIINFADVATFPMFR
jgi:hypothetical protein